MFLVLVPWITIAIINSCIIYRLTKNRNKLRKIDKTGRIHSTRMRQDRQMTVVLLTITFSFLLFLAWQCITQCFFMLGFGKNMDNQSVWQLVDASYAFASLGVVFNSSINFFLYCLSGTGFRRELVQLFCGKRDLAFVTSSSDRSSRYTPTSSGRVSRSVTAASEPSSCEEKERLLDEKEHSMDEVLSA